MSMGWLVKALPGLAALTLALALAEGALAASPAEADGKYWILEQPGHQQERGAPGVNADRPGDDGKQHGSSDGSRADDTGRPVGTGSEHGRADDHRHDSAAHGQADDDHGRSGDHRPDTTAADDRGQGQGGDDGPKGKAKRPDTGEPEGSGARGQGPRGPKTEGDKNDPEGTGERPHNHGFFVSAAARGDLDALKGLISLPASTEEHGALVRIVAQSDLGKEVAGAAGSGQPGSRGKGRGKAPPK